MKPLIAGNWKMNGLGNSISELTEIAMLLAELGTSGPNVLVCVPATLIHRAAKALAGTDVRVGGQDCHMAKSGAHTGDVSAEMLADAGASAVIVGHSERRTGQAETDGIVNKKAQSALAAGLMPIICVGETEAQRDAGQAVEVVCGQLEGSVPGDLNGKPIAIAYEPVWAIGTGRVPTPKDIVEMHGAIRKKLTELMSTGAEDTPILYGGSMKPDNARDILGLENVNGGLVGGASLKAADFGKIIEAAA